MFPVLIFIQAVFDYNWYIWGLSKAAEGKLERFVTAGCFERFKM